MDELVIGDKKYVSSKQAAKATGYAKDYVGQLCREGRVPARLVGRSWYVLESAIHDHRFGEPKEALASEKTKESDIPAVPVSAWGSPRYTTVEAETLPSVNRLRIKDSPPSVDDEESSIQNPQNTWQAWFDKFGDIVQQTSAVGAGDDSKGEEKAVEQVVAENEPNTPIPIHAIYNYRPPAVSEESSISHRRLETAQEEDQIQPEKGQQGTRRTGRTAIRVSQFAGVLIALVTVSAAILGSGYFDAYIISSKTARPLAGIILYQK